MNKNYSLGRRSVLSGLAMAGVVAASSPAIALAINRSTGVNGEGQLPREEPPGESDQSVRYRTVQVNGVEIFYREAGPKDAPILLLLHGYPSSSRMFDPLLPLLAKSYRCIAPDYPGFGHSQMPDRHLYPYTFEHLAKTIAAFTEALALNRYSLYMQDYGGPVGFHLALAHPQRVQALIVQNAVIHEAGLSDLWKLRRAFWQDRAAYEQKILDAMPAPSSGVARYVGARKNRESFNPDLWSDEIAFLQKPGVAAVQLELVYDYQNNVREYPRWQAYLKDSKLPLLVLWGVHDLIFSEDGAKSIKNDRPDAELHMLDAGHFALNEQPIKMSGLIKKFLDQALAGVNRS